MALIELNLRPTASQLRWFSRLWFPAFVATVGIVAWYGTGRVGPAAAVWLPGAAVALVAAAWPAAARWVFVGLMVAAYPLGWLMSHALLGAIYYLVLTPIALVMRCVGYDPLERRFDAAAASYWQRREAQPPPERYFRQF